MATTVNGIEDLPYADFRVRRFYTNILTSLIDVARKEEYRKDDERARIEKINAAKPEGEEHLKVPEGTDQKVLDILDVAKHQKEMLGDITSPVIKAFVTATEKTGAEIVAMSPPERAVLMMTHYGNLQKKAMLAALKFVKEMNLETV